MVRLLAARGRDDSPRPHRSDPLAGALCIGLASIPSSSSPTSLCLKCSFWLYLKVCAFSFSLALFPLLLLGALLVKRSSALPALNVHACSCIREQPLSLHSIWQSTATQCSTTTRTNRDTCTALPSTTSHRTARSNLRSGAAALRDVLCSPVHSSLLHQWL